MLCVRKIARRGAAGLIASLAVGPTVALAAPPQAGGAAPPEVRTIGALQFDGVPTVPAELAERALQYGFTRPIRLSGWAPDGRGLLVLTRFGETAQLHRVATPMGARSQWTFGAEPIAFAAARPVGPGRGEPEVVVGIDRGGSEFYQLHLWRRATARFELVTDGKSRHERPLWSRDGASLAFAGTGRNGKDFDLYLWRPGDGPPRRVKEFEGNWYPLDWSADGKRILLQRFVSAEFAELFALDLASGTLAPIAVDPDRKPAAYNAARFDADGGVWLTTDAGSDVLRLWHLPRIGPPTVAPLSPRWPVEAIEVAPNGVRVAAVVNEDGWSRIHTLGADGKAALVAGAPHGVVTQLAWSPDSTALAFSLTSAQTPGDVWVASWPAGKPKVERWTETEAGGLPVATFADARLVHYPTFDADEGRRRQIPAFVYKPAGKGPFPFVIHIHGGPEGQARPWFDPAIQFWVRELGLAVIAPNVRGSDGYGKAFLALDNGRKRADSVRDIGALLDWAGSQPDLDPKRAAVYGGSYGGFMVLASLVQYGDRLKAGVDIVGISNFVTFLENTLAYRRDARRAEYGDERDPAMREFLYGVSPLTHANRIRSRLFVVQGANDPRVPRSEAEQIVRAVRAAGQAVWYLLAHDEGHGFQRKSNRDALLQSVALFWQSHLL